MAPLSSLLHPYSGLSRLPFQPSYSSNAAPTPSLPLYILPLRPTTLEPASPVISSLPPLLHPPPTPLPFRLFFALRPYPPPRHRERERPPPPPPFSFPARAKTTAPPLSLSTHSRSLCKLIASSLALAAHCSHRNSLYLRLLFPLPLLPFPPPFLRIFHETTREARRVETEREISRPEYKPGRTTLSLRVVSASIPDTHTHTHVHALLIPV